MTIFFKRQIVCSRRSLGILSDKYSFVWLANFLRRLASEGVTEEASALPVSDSATEGEATLDLS